MIEQKREPKKVQQEKNRSSETEDHQKQGLATPKRLKRGDEKYIYIICTSVSNTHACVSVLRMKFNTNWSFFTSLQCQRQASAVELV